MGVYVYEPEGLHASHSDHSTAKTAYVLGRLVAVLSEEGISAELVPALAPHQLILRVDIVGDEPFLLSLHHLVPS